MLITATFGVRKYSPCSKPFVCWHLQNSCSQAQHWHKCIPWECTICNSLLRRAYTASLPPSLYLCCFFSRSLPSEVIVQYCSYSRYTSLQRKGNILLWLEASLLLIHCPLCCRPHSSLLLCLSLIFNTIKECSRNTLLKAEKFKSMLSSTLTVSQLKRGLASDKARK